jgi:predicted acetyltransferase
MSDVELRVAKKDNFEKLASIYLEEFSKPPYNEDWTLDKAVAKLELFSKYCDIWEIDFDGEVIGMVVINPNHWSSGKIAFCEEVAIKNEYQRKGFGVEVFEKIFEIYKERGFEEYMGIVNKKSKSFGFHKKIGASVLESDVLMSRKL